jgi:hypothetical protein
MFRTVVNPGTSPVVIDRYGRTLGGGEWGSVDDAQTHAADAVEAGRLRALDGPQPDGTAAGGAAKRTAELEDRANVISGWSDAQRADAARAAGLDSSGDDLVYALAVSDAPVSDAPVTAATAAAEPAGKD